MCVCVCNADSEELSLADYHSSDTQNLLARWLSVRPPSGLASQFLPTFPNHWSFTCVKPSAEQNTAMLRRLLLNLHGHVIFFFLLITQVETQVVCTKAAVQCWSFRLS